MINKRDSLKSWSCPNLIAPVNPGTYGFSFLDLGLEIWPCDDDYKSKYINWFTITTPGQYGVYGTNDNNISIFPL